MARVIISTRRAEPNKAWLKQAVSNKQTHGLTFGKSKNNDWQVEKTMSCLTEAAPSAKSW